MWNERVLVTGGTGFIGSHLVRRLREAGAPVTLLFGRVEDTVAVRRAVAAAKPDVVYHLASTSFQPATTPVDAHFRVIVQGTLSVLEAVRGQGGGRVILTGSAAEYGSGSNLAETMPLRPATLLGAAKASASVLAETYGRLYGMETVVLRIFTPFGPGEKAERLIPHVIGCALAGRPVRLHGGTQQRDFFYVDDLIDALLAAARAPLPNPAVMNLCSGTGREVRAVAADVLRLMSSQTPIQSGDFERPDEILLCSGDPSEARRLLGWLPKTSFEDGLRATIAWFREYPR